MVNIHERSPVPACVPAHPDPSSSISPDDWRRLEGATFSVMCKIHPTVSVRELSEVNAVFDEMKHAKIDGRVVLRF